MTVRKLRAEDARRAAEIEKSSLSVPWSECELALFAQNENGIYFVAEEDGVICGVCGAYAGAGECNINNVAVESTFRRRGIARALIKATLAESKKRGCGAAYLEVASKNAAAISLYSSLGFAPYAKRRRFYGDDDAILMKTEEL